MKLLEYQAKEVLASLGIPIPPGRVARTPEEAASACAELGPVAVKAQVPVGGRGKAGGIKVVKTPDEAKAAAQQIIGMDIKGFKVPLVYCEAALEIEREVYLGPRKIQVLPDGMIQKSLHALPADRGDMIATQQIADVPL